MARVSDYIGARIIGCLRSAASSLVAAAHEAERRINPADPFGSLTSHLVAMRAGQLHAATSIEAAVNELRGQHIAMTARGNRLAEEVQLLLADMATPELNVSLAQALKEWKEIAP